QHRDRHSFPTRRSSDLCVEEGAQIVLTNAPIALRMGAINQLAEKCNAPVIPADVTNPEDIENLFDKSLEHFEGKVDFILHSIGIDRKSTRLNSSHVKIS